MLYRGWTAGPDNYRGIDHETEERKRIGFRSVQKPGGRNSTTEGADRGPKSEKILAQFLALFSGFSPVLAHSKSAFASQNELEQIKRKKPETVAVSGFP